MGAKSYSTKKEALAVAKAMKWMLPKDGVGWEMRLRDIDGTAWFSEWQRGRVTVKEEVDGGYFCFIHWSLDGSGGLGPCTARGISPKKAIKKCIKQMLAHIRAQHSFWGSFAEELEGLEL